MIGAASRTLDAAAEVVANAAHEAETRLGTLPDPARRGAGERAEAARVHAGVRRVRREFLDVHAEAVYDELTAGRTSGPRASELVSLAAERFPGLVPTPGQMRQEACRAQPAKEGREIDQGLFFRAVLRCQGPGLHLMGSMREPTPQALAELDRYRTSGVVELPTVELRRHGDAAHLTMHNEHCLNAEDDRLTADMEVAVDLVALDPASRVGMLRGGVMTHPKYRGRRVFSAGLNLVDLHEGRISFVAFMLERELGYVSKLLHGVLVDDDPVHVPWIGVVDTFAIGGGTQLLLVLDRVIAVEGAHLSLPAANEGIVPGLAALRLGRLGGGRLTRGLILGGRRLDVAEPAAAAIVDTVVRPEDVEAVLSEAVADLAAPAVAANRRLIALAEEPPDLLRAFLAEFAHLQASRLYDEDVLRPWRPVR